jgi:hypothetical protein
LTSGLSISAARFQDAATRLATSAARASRPAEMRTGSFADQADRLATASSKITAPGGMSRTSDLAGAQVQDNFMYTPSFAEDLVNMRLAVQAYKANAKTFQLQSEMADAVLKLADGKR